MHAALGCVHMKNITIEPKLVTAEQAARLFNVSLRYIRGLQYSGRVPTYRIGTRLVRFNRYELEQALIGTVTPDAGGVH